jgi:integrase
MKKDNPLFAIAADDYMNEIMGLNKYGSYKTNKRIVSRLTLEFGHKRIRSITRQDIQRYITKLHENVGVNYLRSHLGVLKGIMEYSDDEWVMPRIKVPKCNRPRQEFYTFEEVRKIAEEASGQDQVLTLLLAETGCRIGEALALKIEDIRPGELSISKNVYEGVIQSTPKTDSSIRKVAISETLYLEIISLKRRPGEYIFQSPTGRPEWPQRLTTKFRIICKKAGVEYKGFHAFRRGHVTECCNTLGIPERIVGARVGHGCSGMTLGVYAQFIPGSDKPWVDKIAALLYEGKQHLTNDQKGDMVNTSIGEKVNGITDN